MVDLAILLGILSNIIFGLGILGWLTKGVLNFLALISLTILIIFLWKKKIWLWFEEFWEDIKKDRLCLFLTGLWILQILVNLVGALGPELGFDALWYHLTLPKIYLQESRIFFIRGGLFYYSAIPKLTEMLYLLSLNFSRFGILSKLIHFSFGILSSIVLYNLSKRYLKERFSLLVVLFFYTSLIVGWESISAYVDLSRTFFELLALDEFLIWWRVRQKESLINSAVCLGLAISTKLIAFATLPVFLILIFLKSKKIPFSFLFFIFSLLIPLPWLVFSYLYTGNPVFPIFSHILDETHKIVQFNFLRFFRDFFVLLYRPQDPISPVFLIFLPLLVWGIIRGRLKKLYILASYVFLAYIFWYFTPRTGGARFILPYLPAWSLLTVGLISQEPVFFQKFLIFVVALSSLTNIGYRSLANKKFIPFLIGRESKDQFLEERLNFNFGDFYDLNGEVKKIIGKDDLVLVSGSHNLFYVDFLFIHSSYARKDTPISLVLVQGKEYPKDVKLGKLVYKNPKTNVELYLFKGWQN